MESIVDILKKKCTGLFVHSEKGEFRDLSFGVKLEDNIRLRYCCLPYTQNYSFVNFLFLPKPFAILASKLNNPVREERSAGIYIFHYYLNEKKLLHNIQELYKNDFFFWNREKSLQPEQRIQKEPVPPDKYIKWFVIQYGPASCIYTNFLRGTIFLGNVNNMQNIMEYFKAAQNNFLDVMKDLTGLDGMKTHQEQTIDLYDFLKKPKQVHYDLKKS